MDNLRRANVPEWIGNLYLTEEEWNTTRERKNRIPESFLEGKIVPIIPQLAPIVEAIVKVSNSRDFNDSFRLISTSFAFGLITIRAEVRLEEIENEEMRELLGILFLDIVQVWLKMQALYDIQGVNLVRNMILDRIGLLREVKGRKTEK